MDRVYFNSQLKTTRGNNQGRYFVTNSAVGKVGEVAFLKRLVSTCRN